MQKFTQKRLRALLDYDSSTGIFTHKLKRKGVRGVGNSAGSMMARGYICIAIDGYSYYAHRLAWFWIKGRFPKKGIDHINGNRADNRISNLRLASPSQNTAWRKLNKNNTSGFRGVSFHPLSGLWASRIKVHWHDISLGYYKSKLAAAVAYDEAAVRYFGAFAKTNKALGLYR